MSTRKRQHHADQPRKKAKTSKKSKSEGSTEEVLRFDVKVLLREHGQDRTSQPAPPPSNGEESSTEALPKPFTEIQLKIASISSTGDGLAFDQDTKHVYVVPFTAPGDTVIAKVIRHFPLDGYSLTDFVRVTNSSSLRDDSRIKCNYFRTCSGCQFQMLSYPTQLAHKRTVIEKAYKNFSGLDPKLVPPVAETTGSPLQYGYRTKLTPHFDKPRIKRSEASEAGDNPPAPQELPPIGFMQKGMRRTIDIEDCPIGTEVLRMGLKRERARVAVELHSYKRGATILLRESTTKISKRASDTNGDSQAGTADPDIVREDHQDYVLKKSCVTDHKATTTEYISSYIFRNSAGAFFQNNNSILPAFTSYIRSHALPSSPSPIKYLIDAYCGSGLFTVTLSSLFISSMGIDISPESVTAAVINSRRNGITNSTFKAEDATAIFASVTYPPDETVVVIDPPRKGCDEAFLRQLAKFGPSRIVYVSCNVHTQARDVGFLIKELGTQEGGSIGGGGGNYEIESLRGFDFFPQTSHVESVAILNKIKPHDGVANEESILQEGQDTAENKE
ncbi:MAG: tRNA(m5U54)methyltransferase [Peltula sp. TS41687]|nr:MAG: tRNA(m5U54)methyltransferase [Peltula sp. TS41687]